MPVKTRAIAALAAATVCAALLTGCGNANAGTGAGADFTQYMEGQPGVARAFGGGSNDLPFIASVTGHVVLSDDVTEDQIEAVVDRAGEYYARHDSEFVDWLSVRVSVGLFEISVAKTRLVNDDLRVLFSAVRADSRYVGAAVGAQEAEFALADAPSAEALVTGLDTTVGFLTRYPVAAGSVVVSIAAEPDGFPEYQLTQHAGAGRPDAAIAALEALWATTVPLTARVNNERFSVTLGDEAAVPAALALVTPILAGSTVTEISVEGPN